MRAALLTEEPGRLELADVTIDKPQVHEVLIRTIGSGLCHSDLHVIDRPRATAFGTLPMVLGHEAAGIVEAVGDDVTYVRPGDHVITFCMQFCGECEFCLRGRPTLCANSPGPRASDAPPRLTMAGDPVSQFANLGGFAEEMLVHEHALVKIDPDYPLDRAAIIGCGVATGLGAALNTAQVQPGSSVAVVGCGGVGLAVVQGAAIAGARQIVAVDMQPSKFDLARKLGATDCVDASAGDPVGQVLELTGGGVDYAFEAIGLRTTAEQAVGMLRPAGTATIVGVGIGELLQIDMAIFLGERRIQGCLMGSNRFRTDLPHYIQLDQMGRLDVGSMIETHIALDDVNDGYEAMRRQAINGRRVIMFPE
ncbi:MAG TPA: Zn-dependent alcohol dehydrogenase [Acidimicrobiia bacterium]|nr:Zn-dependent alcohol dehydrogenase [Acidimicrobiia bacterium]